MEITLYKYTKPFPVRTFLEILQDDIELGEKLKFEISTTLVSLLGDNEVLITFLSELILKGIESYYYGRYPIEQDGEVLINKICFTLKSYLLTYTTRSWIYLNNIKNIIINNKSIFDSEDNFTATEQLNSFSQAGTSQAPYDVSFREDNLFDENFSSKTAYNSNSKASNKNVFDISRKIKSSKIKNEIDSLVFSLESLFSKLNFDDYVEGEIITWFEENKQSYNKVVNTFNKIMEVLNGNES